MSTSSTSSSNTASFAAAASSFQDESIRILDTATPALVSGAIQSVLFNPFDRALYVRVQSRRRRFLDRRNFERPFQGFGNAAVYRTIVGASYIFWQDNSRVWLHRLCPDLTEASHPTLHAVTIGLVAGSVNGLALNNLQAIKFRMWSLTPTDAGFGGGFMSTARSMYANGGVSVFFRGCIVTMQRDAVFGMVYESLRRAKWLKNLVRRTVDAAQQPKLLLQAIRGGDHQVTTSKHHTSSSSTASESSSHGMTFLCNLIAAVVATMASSPWNFVRSVSYGCPPNAQNLPRSMVVRFLYMQAKYAFQHGETYRKIAYHSSGCLPMGWHFRAAFKVINRRLNVGWGSLRVGLGMAVGQHVFSLVQTAMVKVTPASQHYVVDRK